MSKLRKMSESDKISNKELILYNTGLIAIGLIILQDYISTGISDTPIFVSVIAFSIALPLLVGSIVLIRAENERGYYNYQYNPYHMFNEGNSPALTINISAMLCAFVGIAAAIWHILWIAGILFLIGSIFFGWFVFRAAPEDAEIERLQREEFEREKALE